MIITDNIIKIIISILLAYLISQTSKSIINYKRTKKWDWISFVFENGGMPSSHTSTTVALTASLLFETGISYYFIISFLFTMIVMNDAMKVRRETGEEATILNIVMEKEKILHKRLTERIGHTPLQVTMGVFVGILSAFIVYII